MAEPVAEYEGTWEDIAMHAPEFRGRRLRLLVLADEAPPPLSLQERRAILKLPLEERRRRLAEQAEELADYYERDTEWREFLAGDIVEYGDQDA